jgi:hypothetical protein
MKTSNAPELLAQKDIDGGLIGGAALEARSCVELVTAAAVKRVNLIIASDCWGGTLSTFIVPVFLRKKSLSE